MIGRMIEKSIESKAGDTCSHSAFGLVFERQEWEQLLADHQSGNAYCLAQYVLVKHREVRFLVDKKPGLTADYGDQKNDNRKNGKRERNEYVYRK